MTLLSEQETADRLASSDWRREDQAIALVNRVAEVAEAQNHHPDILVHGWNKVRLELSTHSEGGLTDADFEMAARIDDLL
jgi:4a-hydroxytetrahydrobiopterin dehydratase